MLLDELVAASASPSSSTTLSMDAARLRRQDDIAVVREDGVVRRDRFFVLRSRPNQLAVVRIAVSASRELGPKVQRNRARRRLREAFRLELGLRAEAAGADVLMSVRRSALDAPSLELRAAAGRAVDGFLGAQ